MMLEHIYNATSLLLSSSSTIAPNPDENKNDNKHLSPQGTAETLAINFFVFIILMMIFESNRFYKQIYLKRLQNRFLVSQIFLSVILCFLD